MIDDDDRMMMMMANPHTLTSPPRCEFKTLAFNTHACIRHTEYRT